MSTESFRLIQYSDKDKFVSTQSGRIELKKYSEDLLLYTSFDSTINATYGAGEITPLITGTVTPENNGVFAQAGYFQNGQVRFSKSNFTNLTKEGTIKFRLKTDFSKAYGKQSFIRTTTPFITSLPIIDKTIFKFGGGSLNLIGAESKNISYNISNISTLVQLGTIEFFARTFYSGVPSSNVQFFNIENGINNENKITVLHKTDGNLYFQIYDQTGTKIVEISFAWSPNTSWNHYCFNFDLNNGNSKVFINGIQYGPTSTNTGTRTPLAEGSLVIGSVSPNITNFFIDDFAIFNVKKYDSNFTIRTVSLSSPQNNLIVFATFDTSTSLNIGAATTPISSFPTDSQYKFKLYIADELYNEVSLNLLSTDNLTTVMNKIAVALNGAPVVVSFNSLGQITITAAQIGASISIEAPDSGRNLITILDGVEDSKLPNGPTEDTILVEFYNGVDDENRIQIIHTSISEIIVKMYDNLGMLRVEQNLGEWTNYSFRWASFAFCWNETMAQFYIDGELRKIFQTFFERGNNTYLYLRSHSTDFYYFDELIVYNTYKHQKNYTVEVLSLTPYSSDRPYIDVNFGNGFKENEIKGININCSTGCNFIVSKGSNWYYYFNNGWRSSDGSFSRSNSRQILQDKFADLYFDESEELSFRIFFDSDGLTNQWIDEISIDVQRVTENKAIIIGSIDLENPVDLSVNNTLIITTDQGTAEIDLSSEALDSSAVTAEEIITAINNANVPGLDVATLDSNNRIILQSDNVGVTGFVSVDGGSAIAIVWGEESSDYGEEAATTFYNYEPLFSFIRSSLGAPITPVELTDEQIENCIGYAVYWYNYYRSAKEKRITITLSGNETDGYEIPPEVGGESNIIEIIVKPRFPLAYYGSADASSILSNVFMQWMFQKGKQAGFQHFLGDYYITLSTQRDYENILGTRVKWNFYNDKIFIHPRPINMQVGIVFKSAIDINEINTNPLIKKFALGRAKQILGTIRATFGGTLPGGGEVITLRAEGMINEGKEEEKEALEQMMKLSPPLFLDFG